MKVPIIMQMHSGENGAAALAMILAYYKKHLPMETIRKKCLSSRNGSSLKQLYDTAVSLDMEAEIQNIDFEELKKISLPVIALWKRCRYVVIRGFKRGKVLLNDPAKGVYSVTEEKFKSLFNEKILILKPGVNFKQEGKPVSIFKLIFGRISNFKRSSLIIVVLHSLSIILNLTLVALSRYMLDDVAGLRKYILYLPILTAMTIALLFRIIFSIVQTLYSYKISRNMSAASSSRLFKKLVSLPMKFYDQHYIGDIMERFDTNATLDHSLLNTISPSIIDIFMIFVYLSLMLFYNTTIALICFVFEIIYIIVSLLLQEKISTVSHSLNSSSGALGSSILNGLNTMDTIKSVGGERHFFSMWNKTQNVYQDNRHKILRARTLSSFYAGWHSTITSAILLFIGAFFIMNGNFTLGMMSSFQSVLNYMKSSMNKSVQTMNDLSSMRSNIERVDDVLTQNSKAEIPIKNTEEIDKVPGVIDIENVTFYYNKGDKPAIDNLTLHIRQGEMIALLGSTGCGKSTLIKLIASLYEPSSGTIKYAGKTRDEIPDAVFHSSIATVDQETMLFEDSIVSNLKLWDESISDEEMISAAKEAQIHDRIMESVNGYKSQILENGSNYSSGEQQRMELTRALSRRPNILLLDEFTSSLDAITEEKVFKAIKESGITCIIAAHRMSTVVDCDQLIVLEHGRLLETGNHDELYSTQGEYRKLMDKQ